MTADTVALIAFAWLGLSVGSFLNVSSIGCHADIGRAPVVTLSNCGYELRWFDNIPVLSWLTLKGAAGNAERRSASGTPIVEILTMLVFLLHWWVFGWTLLMAVRLLFACALIALFAIDRAPPAAGRITLPGLRPA